MAGHYDRLHGVACGNANAPQAIALCQKVLPKVILRPQGCIAHSPCCARPISARMIR